MSIGGGVVKMNLYQYDVPILCRKGVPAEGEFKLFYGTGASMHCLFNLV